MKLPIQPFNLATNLQHLGWLTGSLILLSTLGTPVQAGTLLNESFTGTSAPSWEYGTSGTSAPPCLTAGTTTTTPSSSGMSLPLCPSSSTGGQTGSLPDGAGNGALRLTSSAGNQADFVIYTGSSVSSSAGLTITFDFFSYGGNNFGGTGADGIVFFLLDASQPIPTQSGAFGGSLGYAQKTNINGIGAAYLGVGLDEFGNFSNPTEGRDSGCNTSPLQSGPGQKPQAVTIRGAGTGGQTGYCFLNTSNTLSSGLSVPSATTRSTNGVKRTARITLSQSNLLTVEIDFGSGFQTVISSFNIASLGQPSIPTNLRFGFASSSGGGTNFHEIRNLNVSTIPPDLSLTNSHTGNITVGQQGKYTLQVSNSPLAGPTTGSITVTDTLPTGLSFVSSTGTNWSCSANGQTVTCTYSGAAPASGTSLPAITLNVNVTGTAGTSVTNSATVSTPGDSNTANNTTTDTTTIVPPSRLRLVKRITAINATSITNVVDPTTTSDPNDDNSLNWPSGYLRGAINGGSVKPGDVVEYTIYFLSDGGNDATNVTICDLVPANTTFISTAFNGLTPTDGGLPGVDSGIALAIGSTTPTFYLTNVADAPDRGQFFSPGTQAPVACNSPSFTSPVSASSNVSGAVVVNVVTSPTTLPKANAPGNPANSYGFVRFRVRVN